MTTPAGAWRRTAVGAGLLGPNGEVSPTIFAEMTALAVAEDAINLGQGFPDEDGPREVLDEARRAIADGENQYPPGRGIAPLREAIAAHRARFYGLAADPDTEIIVTAGATEALAATLLALCDGPDDEVVVFDPCYDAYAATVALAGARLRRVPLRWPDFAPDLDALGRAVTDRTRIILLTDPHNPTGTVLTDDARREIVRLAERHDALIVTDEVYEHLSFGAPFRPIAQIPGAAERTISISSAGKTFRTTGWKVGWLIAPAPLATAILTVKQFLTYAGGTPFQSAIALGLALPDRYFAELAGSMAAAQTALGGALRGAGFEVSAPVATYFTVADAAGVGGADAAAFCRALPAAIGVAAVPLAAFVADEHRASYASLVRFAACKRPAVITEAARRLQRLGSATTR
ncbi:aminotransferase class I/II-fold pyridoxal phosphate-dependent enzyme [Microbacterium excoecariae]|uniref:aminotransferase class I/II-fold pyridoxal phosphate-dependent enzyme n=1 Tax=Microbacterium excoecariae TaxID=2715210 RepID=UPI001407DADF|nr:aminotransferase class I/II-fold pyridoxal phosphate-dependent enzyme [Microbacterium excoecariae]NHI17286.1 aminotransferase class I/II-fold pyridoxal phosphate-dependent enzyme [Microbacterium excoecariae]